MSRISRADIEKVARLSRLAVTPAEAETSAAQLAEILDYAASLDSLDVSGVEPTSHSLNLTNAFREDVPVPSLAPEEALANAPEAEAQCFRVPTIIQG